MPACTGAQNIIAGWRSRVLLLHFSACLILWMCDPLLLLCWRFLCRRKMWMKRMRTPWPSVAPQQRSPTSRTLGDLTHHGLSPHNLLRPHHTRHHLPHTRTVKEGRSLLSFLTSERELSVLSRSHASYIGQIAKSLMCNNHAEYT